MQKAHLSIKHEVYYHVGNKGRSGFWARPVEKERKSKSQDGWDCIGRGGRGQQWKVQSRPGERSLVPVGIGTRKERSPAPAEPPGTPGASRGKRRTRCANSGFPS